MQASPCGIDSAFTLTTNANEPLDIHDSTVVLSSFRFQDNALDVTGHHGMAVWHVQFRYVG